MRNWIARLLKGGSTDASVAAPAPSPAASASAPDQQALDARIAIEAEAEAEVEQRYWRWLCGLPAAAAEPPAPAARLILDELARLTRAPEEAAGLVPRVPEVIPRLLRSLRDEAVSGAELARQVSQDTVLVAEVIREANAPFYRPAKPVRTLDAALLVLGQNGLRMLLARVAFRPIIGASTGACARLAAPRLWQHAQRCARAAALLAPPLAADPFEGYLAGLMIDVGLIVALRLIDQLQDNGPPPGDPAVVAALLAGARQLSGRIALTWALPPPIGAALLHAGLPNVQPLARALGRADQLARLRLLFEGGVLVADAPPLGSLDAGAARVFERLGPEPD